MNNFQEQLAYSESASDEPFWGEVYKKAFPDMACHILNTAGKSQSQNLGIDRIIHLKSGKTILVDEKKRKTKWNDILLEYKSNSTKSTNDGWMNKQLHIDYLAYAFMSTKEVYLLDWQTLRRAWLSNGVEWVKKYGTKYADNKHYKTLSVPVPIDVLLKEVSNANVIKII